MNILLTGSSGFIASNLYKLFYKDFPLLGLDITTKGAFLPKTVYDWQQLPQIAPVNTIIHLAGKAHDTKNRSKEPLIF
jgi:nucleoside-diphosphate-sugar epimerase